ncbi:glycosyltransferase family 4 protein [Arvimicrobium flavum]|uniref:glycosyltransferase family 4 protein n=1 Tax=Arvimicrobium flavum TaxID=3393320 RepID=UPI00237AA577|nr:glycosyltransferase family 4 protein [Mesorhizobium shangrilense]
MKVLVVNNAVPFIWGGAEELARNLVLALNGTKGVSAELLRIPFNWVPNERLIDEILLNQAMHIPNVDKMIALKFPAYLVPHHRKTLWLLHQFRQAYDLRDAGQSPLGQDPDSLAIVEAIRRADDLCFANCQRIFTNSPVTQNRLRQYNKRKSEVLYPPLNDEALFRPVEYGDYIFAGGRVSAGKRQRLLIEAMKHTRTGVKLIVAGPPESEETTRELTQLVEKEDLADRVVLKLGLLSRDEIASLANNARACAYLPFDEDSLGYVTMEAFAAGKAVLTTSDSGGLLEIVKHQSTGFVAEPNAEAIAAGLDVLNDPATARKLGGAANALWKQRNLTWAKTVDRLLS